MKILPGTERIQNIVNTTLHTVLLKDNTPVSLLLVAPSGGGKSQTLLRWEAPWVHHTGDITSQGLFDLLEGDKENKIRTLILPDFNLPLSHKASVTNLTVANMLSLLSEGVARIDDGRKKKEIKHAPISFLSAVTPEMYFQHYKRWKSIGLLRRFLLINYGYTYSTRQEGLKAIRENRVSGLPLEKHSIRKRLSEHVVLLSPEIDAEIEKTAIELARNLGYVIIREKATGQVKWSQVETALEFSPYVCMRTMARAHALFKERFSAGSDDIEFLKDLLKFTNPQSPEKI